MFKLMDTVGLKVTFLENLLNQHPLNFFYAYVLFTAFSAFLATAGYSVFGLLSAVLMLVTSMIALNPFIPENRISAPFGIKVELLLAVGVAIAMMVNATSNTCTEGEVLPVNEKAANVIDNKAQRGGRDDKKNSEKKNKKQL